MSLLSFVGRVGKDIVNGGENLLGLNQPAPGAKPAPTPAPAPQFKPAPATPQPLTIKSGVTLNPTIQLGPNRANPTPPAPQPHASILHDLTHNPVTNLVSTAGKNIESSAKGMVQSVENAPLGQFIQHGPKGFVQGLKNSAPPPVYLPGTNNHTLKNVNPAYSQYIQNLAMGSEGGGLEDVTKPKPVSLVQNADKGNIPSVPKETPIALGPNRPLAVTPFVQQTTRDVGLQDTGNFGNDLEANIKRLSGNYEANRLLTTNLIDQAQKAMEKNPDDFEAAYHYAEDPTVPLTPSQQHVFDTYVQPLRNSIQEGTNALRGTEFEGTEDHIPRIALEKHSNLEQYLTGDRGSPTEGVLRKTANAAQQKRSMYALTDEQGNRTVVSIKTPKDKLGKAVGGKRVTAFINGQPEDLGTMDRVANVGKTFVDKNGKKYTLGDATTKEIEANTGVRYLHNPVITSALAHTNIRNAINANVFNQWMRLHPDFAEHAAQAGKDKIPQGWKPVDSPYFHGWYFDPKTAKTIETQFGSGGGREPGAIAKTWNGLTNTAVQFIVINPLIHGQNLYQLATEAVGGHNPIVAGKGFANLNVNLTRMVADSNFRQQAVQDYLRAGGHTESYGSDHPTFISKALEAAHLPGVNKANAKAMAGIEILLRSAAHEANLADGMDAAESVSRIDKFMGGKANIPETAKAIGMFYHYLVTLTKGTGEMVAHPVKNSGAITNLALGAAAILGVNYALQEASGNPNAHVRNPGEIGFLTGLEKAPGELKSGRVPTIVSTHVNPLIQAGINQAAGEDLGTGQKLDTGKLRLQNLAQKTVAPIAPSMKINQGKSTPAEYGAQQLLGLNFPHASGNPAVPNASGVFKLLNTSNATPATTLATNNSPYVDPTGYQQEQAYFNARQALDGSLGGPTNTRTKDAVNGFLDRSKTNTGQTIQLSPADSENNWGTIAADPNAIAALQKFYQSQPNHNPEWDMSGTGTINGQPVSQMQLYAVYKSLPPGDLQKAAIAQENPWISQAETASSNWAAQQQFSGNAVSAPGYVQPPIVDPNTQAKQNQIALLSNIPAGQRSQQQIQLLSSLENDPAVQNAYNASEQYTNAVRQQMHLPEIQYGGKASPDVQNWENAYMTASATTRKSMRTQNPNMYNAMQADMEQQQLAQVEKYGGEAYYGANVPNSFLGGIYGLGNYDITKLTNPNGTSNYALTDFTGKTNGTGPNGMPTITASQAKAAGTGSGGSSSKKQHVHLKHVHPKHARRAMRIKPMHHSPYLKFNGTNKGNIKLAETKLDKPLRIKTFGV